MSSILRSSHWCSHFENVLLIVICIDSAFRALPNFISSKLSLNLIPKHPANLKLCISFFCLFFLIVFSVRNIALYACTFILFIFIYLFFWFVDYLSSKVECKFHNDRGISELSLLYLFPIDHFHSSLKPLKPTSKSIHENTSVYFWTVHISTLAQAASPRVWCQDSERSWFPCLEPEKIGFQNQGTSSQRAQHLAVMSNGCRSRNRGGGLKLGRKIETEIMVETQSVSFWVKNLLDKQLIQEFNIFVFYE